MQSCQTSIQPAKKAARLRLACDACTTAKVKCSRTKPCERCTERNEGECRYSASRRHGKRTGHKKIELSPEMTTAEPTPAAAMDGPAALLYPDYSDDLEDCQWLNRNMGMDIPFNADKNGLSYPDPAWITPPASIIQQPCAPANHNCEMEAMSILQSLYLSPGGDQADPLSIPTLDTVLVANQAALARLTSLLTCSCAKDPHIALLHGAIVSKIIFWYRAGVTGQGQTEGVAGAVPLRPMEMQLGILDLDADDQTTIQRTVLLRELRKAEKALHRMGAYLTGEGKSTTCQSMAMQNIQEELGAIVQAVKEAQEE
jgi:Aflatoxin regulatory protein/Fungal Zn(2)-Cys(6) binuclear cluster domain